MPSPIPAAGAGAPASHAQGPVLGPCPGAFPGSPPVSGSGLAGAGWPYPLPPPGLGPPPPLPPRPPSRTLARLRLALSAALAAVVLGAFGIAAMMVYYTITLPDPLTLRHKERAPVIRILSSDGSVLAERGTAHDFMPLDLLPKQVTDAVVATEDRRFYEHWGVDPAGMARAFFANLRAGRFAQGGSTLTQQLAKNLFLTHDRTLGRKVEELLLALWLELRLAKSDILELYLNRVYFGGGAYGIESAAQRYFEKSARELTLAEAAIIAGLLKAPSRYAPTSSPGAARARGRVVLGAMVAGGYIGRAEEKRAAAEKVRFAEPKAGKEPDGVEYAVDFVLERMPPLIGAGHAEVVVETTLDAALQRRAHQIVARRLAAEGAALDASQAAVVVLDGDGGIRALVGGRNYADSQYNRAVKSRRQPGSAFKPFVFLAALESGLTPDSVAYDLPLSIEGWTPRNTTGRYQGAMPLRKALAESVNTVAARLQFDLGARRVAEVARRLGIKSELREDPSLALGTSEVSLVELVGSYGVLANGGSSIAPHAIRRVRMSSGRVLYARGATRTDQIVAPAHVAAMNDMLNAALTQGTGRRAALARHPAAGKTGTTTDFRDAVFVGYTAHFTAGVWTGNDNGKPMNKVMGGGLPAEIWREIMVAAHAGRAPLALPGTTTRSLTVPQSDGGAVARGTDDEPEILPWQRPPPLSALHSAPLAAAPVADSRPAEPVAAPSAGTRPSLARSPAAAPPPSKAMRHPSLRIDEDFIARATRDLPAATSPDGASPSNLAGMPAGFDVEAIRRNLRAAPEGGAQSPLGTPLGSPLGSPPGMMTLGAPPR